MRRSILVLAVFSFCELCACSAHSLDLVIDGQSNQVFDGGSYERLIIRNSDSISVRNAHFAIAFAGSVVKVENSHGVLVENSDIDGGSEACEGVSIVDSQDVTVADNTVHDIADDGFEIVGATGLMIRGNAVYGFEIVQVSDSTFSGNLVFDVRSNAAVFLSNDASGPSEYCRNLVFTNNVFVTPESGFTMYVFQVVGVEIHNNVIWKGLYGGLAVGDAVTDMDVTNNVLHSINYSHIDPPYVPAEHRFGHNRVADVASWNDTPALFGDERGNTVGEPDFTVAPNLSEFGSESAWRQPVTGPLIFALADFTPASDSALVDAGDDATAPPFDALSLPRPQGARADVGAVERAPEPGSTLLQGAAIGLLALLARSRRPR
jgi:Right handed beta helix region